jgi:ParB/RepB/Spo0J family partition protein
MTAKTDNEVKTEYKVKHIPINKIVAGDNDRQTFKREELEQLAKSIRQDGLHQPPTYRPHPTKPGFYEIVMGERRTRAHYLLAEQFPGEYLTIPAIVREMSDEEAARAMFTENLQRADLNPMEEARGYDKRMKQFGWTVSEMAAMIKKSTRHVNDRLLLTKLVPEAQDMIAKGAMGVAWGETMAMLDTNFQRQALQYLTKTERPLLREFQAVCGELQLQQAQSSMFNLDDFFVQAIATHTAAEVERKTRKVPTDPKLPPLKRKGTLAESLENYLAELMRSDDPHLLAAVPIVGTIYEQLLLTGRAFAPHKTTDLDALYKEKSEEAAALAKRKAEAAL